MRESEEGKETEESVSWKVEGGLEMWRTEQTAKNGGRESKRRAWRWRRRAGMGARFKQDGLRWGGV